MTACKILKLAEKSVRVSIYISSGLYARSSFSFNLGGGIDPGALVLFFGPFPQLLPLDPARFLGVYFGVFKDSLGNRVRPADALDCHKTPPFYFMGTSVCL